MNKFVFLLCMMVAGSAFASEDKPFIYNDNAKKNPFAPLVSPEGVLLNIDPEQKVLNIVLEGVVVDAKNNNLAIINGKVVKKGDIISSYTVQEIFKDHVDLIRGIEQLTIKIKKAAS